jgi:hypothetical protein
MPAARKVLGSAVEHDAPLDEDEALDDGLDGAELVRDVEDRDAELAVQLCEQFGERLLGPDVDAGGRLVQDQKGGLARERLGDERALLLPAREVRDRHPRLLAEPYALDGLLDDRSVTPAEWADEPSGREPSRGDDFPHSRRSVCPQLRALSEVAERRSAGKAACFLAEKPRRARSRALQTEDEPDERRLPAAVRTGDRNELAGLNAQIDGPKHLMPRVVGEGNAFELYCGRQPRPS